MAEKTLSLGIAVKRLPDLSQSVESDWGRYVLTKIGKPQSVLISYQEYMGMKETIELLQRPHAMAQINEGLSDISHGHRIPWRTTNDRSEPSAVVPAVEDGAQETAQPTAATI